MDKFNYCTIEEYNEAHQYICSNIENGPIKRTLLIALEKQIPMKIVPDDRDIITCPNCGEDALFELPGYESYKYCANCGQRIDWEAE